MIEIQKGYKQTEVGVIPEDWEVKPISEVSKLINGRGFKPYEWQKEGLPIIRIQNLNGSDEYNYYSGSYDKKLEVESGQLLFAWSGSKGTSFGPHVWKAEKGLLNYHTWKIVINESDIDKEYFLYALRKLTKYIEDKAHGASALVHVQKWEMGKFQFPIPLIKSEQTTIATALSDADALIASLEKLIEKKRAIKQGAMQELLRPKEGWVWKKFKDKDVTDLITCGIAATPIYVDESLGYPFLSSTNVKDGKIVWSNYKHIGKDLHSLLYRNNPPMKGDILYSRVGTIGEAAIVDVDFEFSVYVSLTLIKIGKLLNNEFLKYLLNSKRYKALAQREVLMGGGVGNLNVNVVREFDIPIPKYDEQTRLATILSDMDDEITALEQKLGKYKLVKQGMMQELLTGKIRLI